jgi:uncharacterized membrane protein
MSTNESKNTLYDRLPISRLSLRGRGVVIFLLLILEVVLGSRLAALGSPYPDNWLGAHIGLGLLLMGFSGYVLYAAARAGRAVATTSAALTCLATVGAVVSGFVFLLGNQSNGALLAMEAFGVVALLGALLLIIFGGARSTVAPAPAAGSH